VALQTLPKAEPSLLVEDSVTAIVQVDGKVRDRLEVPPSIDPAELESLARASAAVQRAVGAREIVNVVVRAPKVVSIARKGCARASPRAHPRRSRLLHGSGGTPPCDRSRPLAFPCERPSRPRHLPRPGASRGRGGAHRA